MSVRFTLCGTKFLQICYNNVHCSVKWLLCKISDALLKPSSGVGSKMLMRKMKTRLRCYNNSTVKYVYTRCLECSLGLYVYKSFRNNFVEDLIRVGSYLISRQLRL